MTARSKYDVRVSNIVKFILGKSTLNFENFFVEVDLLTQVVLIFTPIS